MTGIAMTLGPLELIDGRCLLGDSRRPGGSWLEFRADGLYRQARTSAGELTPWPMIVQIRHVIVGRGTPWKGGNFTLPGLLAGRLPGLKGRLGGHLDMTLRDPYGERRVPFDRHPHPYRFKDLAILEELLRQTVHADEAHLLADADWLRRVIERLKQLPSLMSTRKFREAMTQARLAEEPSEA